MQRGKVGILGGGVVGTNACKIAVGIGANVTVLDINAKRLAYLDDIFGSSITTLYATEENVELVLRESDIVVGAVLVAGETAPRLITRQHLSIMQPGAVIVDVAIDQGGCAETSKPTTHDDPIYIVDGIVHYCVANMPGAVARSSTIALTSVTLQYGLHDRGPGHQGGRAGQRASAQGHQHHQRQVRSPGGCEELRPPVRGIHGLTGGPEGGRRWRSAQPDEQQAHGHDSDADDLGLVQRLFQDDDPQRRADGH